MPSVNDVARKTDHYQKAACLQVNLFGHFQLSAAGASHKLKSKKAQALLGYLTLTPNHNETRQRLAGLLWSEAEEERARASLRQTLHELRVLSEAVDIAFLDFANERITLDRTAVDADVWRVMDPENDLESDDLLFSQKRLHETLLLGFDDIDPSFQTWLGVQRQTLLDRLVRRLEAQITGQTAKAELRKRFAEVLLNLDPTHEGACQVLMLVAAERGDVGGALRVYKTLWELLDEEYEVEPSQKTQELVVALKTGTLSAKRPAEDAPHQPKEGSAFRLPEGAPSDFAQPLMILVGTFVNEGVEPKLNHIVEGYRHELIARLVRFREWSVFDGREGVGSIPEVRAKARSLRLDGRAYPSGSGINLTLTLCDSDSGQFLWSNRLEVSFERWVLTLQAIVRQVAVALRVHVSSDRLARLSKSKEVVPSSFDRWLQGQDLISHWRPAGEEAATEIFRAILRDDPSFGPAYSSLVQIMNVRHLVFPGVMRSRAREVEALELARKAVHLDPFDSRAQLSLAWSYAMNDKFDEAILGYRLAHETNDADPWTFVSVGQGLAFCGETSEGLRIAEQVQELGLGAAPTHWGYLVGTRYLAGDYDGCAAAADHAGDVIVNLSAWKAAALALMGNRVEAATEISRFVEMVRRNWASTEPATPENISAWLMTSFPIRHATARDTLGHGLAVAGLPTTRRAEASSAQS